MSDLAGVTTFYAMPSFEPRSTVAVRNFCESGGKSSVVRTVQIADASPELSTAIKEFHDLGIKSIPSVNRLSSRSLWDWVWQNTSDATGTIVVDATSFNRELLAMLLFALSVRRHFINSVIIQYVSTGPSGYTTLDTSLPDSERWLSKGVVSVRSVIGYPGNFRSEALRRVVALAGHETFRLFKTIEFLEPNELTISNERLNSSTIVGANDFSRHVTEELRSSIPSPVISDIDFSAKSIEYTCLSLSRYFAKHTEDNITLVPMNSKLSFIGAAISALINRRVRLVYAVPERYNPNYSMGAGEVNEFDITDLINSSKTLSL